MTQQHLDLRTRRVKPAHERVVDLLRSGPCSRWAIMAALGIRDVSGAVSRANHDLVGWRVENLAAPGEVGRYALVEERTGREG